ncbi:SH3 domain-containing protein [Campylobacter sp.]|uniref:SH3 domain-containing protein n=1 Tax=Campylobacter sp. TaxID=205 RepID=UPI0026F933AF|nr:SH3 domain-containing protein [Campylobacter sp.]
MLRFLSIVLLAIFVFAEEPSVFDMMKDERSEKVIKRPKIPDNIAPTNEPEINLKDSQIYQHVEPSQLILKTSNMPKQAYEGEIFKFTLTANTQDNITVDIQTSISENENIKWLNPNLQWESGGNGLYKSEVYFESNSSNPKNPKITLNLKRNGEFFQTANIVVELPKFKEVKGDKNFNHVVADSFEIKKHKTSKFDDKNLIMVAEISAKNSNIADFYLDDAGIIKQGVDSISGNFDSQTGYYFAVFGPERTKFDFNYFSLKEKKFVKFSLPIAVEDDEISTQIGLNPKQSKFEIYKNIAGYTLLAISFVMFLIKRHYVYLVATIIFGAYGLYQYNPFGSAILKENVNVKILPTQNSTVFYTTKEQQKVEILGERESYKKVIMQDGKIGWVFKNDLFKD